MRNASDLESVKREQERIKRKREIEIGDIRHILSSAEGRRFYWRLLEASKLFGNVMTGNSWTFFHAGEQNIGKMFFADLMESEPDAFAIMQREHKQRQEE